jgi:uncharacterized protein with NRDE domain
MCLLVFFFRAVPDAPLVVGANREEFYARGGEPPRLLDGPCRAVAGLDPVAGGTWFGVNDRGVVVAVTNRPRSPVPLQPRSRGLLTRDLLTSCPSAREAEARATAELESRRYAGCNVVCADQERVVVLQAGDALGVRALPPGLHALANGDVDDEGDRRVGHALGWLAQLGYDRAEDCVAALRRLCAQPGGDGVPAMCFRGPDRGTVSSTIVALRPSLAGSVYLHAQGAPDRTPYADCSSLLQELARGREGA